MYYAHYNEESGQILGFYCDEIHDAIPTPSIPITNEQWREAIEYQNRYKVDPLSKALIKREE